MVPPVDALPAPDPSATGPAAVVSTRLRVWRVARYVIGLVLVGLAIYAVSGKTDELSGASTYLDHLHWTWVILAVVAEAASYVAFAGMQRRLLGAGDVHVSLRPMTSISLAGNAIQTTLPGGIVMSAAWSFRQFRRFGADEILSGWVLVAMTATSFIALLTLAGVGLALAASTGSALGVASVIIGLLFLAIVVVAAWSKRLFLVGHTIRLLRLSQRVIHRPAGDPQTLVHDALVKVGAISPTWKDWGWATAWGACNWLFDLGCLALAFAAVGAEVPWRGLLLAYAAAQLATNLPITPGGLGVVEGSLTVALVAFGGAQASTVAAVLVYRVLSFWLILPLGWATLGVITFNHRRSRSLVLAGPAGKQP
ncbi:MAG: flippase-like domain-containing protein [Actinomycetota bacterium]|nr:flippase-like domain-containing protein [Actinomycetota bacterium]